MPTLRELKAKMKRIDQNRPAADPLEVRRIFEMLAPMAGLIGCGDPGPEDEKKDDDNGEKPG